MFSFRIDDADLARWHEAAKERGVPLANLIRGAVEREIGVAAVTTRAAVATATPRGRKVAAADVVRCPKASLHKKGQRCGYCGQTP